MLELRDVDNRTVTTISDAVGSVGRLRRRTDGAEQYKPRGDADNGAGLESPFQELPVDYFLLDHSCSVCADPLWPSKACGYRATAGPIESLAVFA